MKRTATFLILLTTLILFAGCSTMSMDISPDPTNPVKTVAVLPLLNNTTDVEAPQMVRKKLTTAIDKRHYDVIPVKETDTILRDRMGITLGGQLDSTTVEELKDNLNVDGLVYGTLMDFKEVTTGVYNVRKVRGKFRLVQTSTSETMWQNGIGIKSENKMSGVAGQVADVATDISDSQSDEEVPWETISSRTSNQGFAETLAINLGVKLLSKATNTHLAWETNKMLERVLTTFPAGPVARETDEMLK